MASNKHEYYVRLGEGKPYCPVSKTNLRLLANKGWITANDRIAISKYGPWHKVFPVHCRAIIHVESIGKAKLC